MKTTQSILTAVLSFTASMALAAPSFAGTRYVCKSARTGSETLKLSFESGKLTELTISNYEIIKDGVRQKDRAIGRSVFAVSVSPVLQDQQGTLEFGVSLQDYSDIRSYQITLSQQTGEAAVVETFQSSDGDDLVHVSADNLKCQ